MRYRQSLPIPGSPSVRSRASSETMSYSIASRNLDMPSRPVYGASTRDEVSCRLGSGRMSSSTPTKEPKSGLSASSTRTQTHGFNNHSESSATTTSRSSHGRSESATSAVSSLTDVGEVLNTLPGFPSPPLRLMLVNDADEPGNERVPTDDHAPGTNADRYKPNRRPSASSILTVVSDCATITSADEKQKTRRGSTPSLSLVRTTSCSSAGPRTPLLASCDTRDDAQYGEVMDQQDHYFAARDKGTRHASGLVPPTRETDDWGEIEILDSRR